MLGKKKKKDTDREAPADQNEEQSAADASGVDEKGDQPVDESVALQQENTALNDKLMRALADIANMRRRQTEDRVRLVKDATIRITSELLPILDSFRLAVQTEGGKDELLQGMQMLESMLSDLLDRHGIKKLAAEVAAIFDPNVHEAVAVVESNELPAGSIIAVQMEGYVMGDRVLRPARVVVSRAPVNNDETPLDGEAQEAACESTEAQCATPEDTADEAKREDHADL